MEKSYEEQQFKGPGYELFIMLITILSILNLILILFTRNSEMEQVIFFINIAISLILMFDFFYRLLSSPSKNAYFIKDFGWLDLLGSIPVIGFQVLRLFRIIRVIRILREMGTREVSKEFRQQRASSTMATVAFLVIIVLQFEMRTLPLHWMPFGGLL
jgi:voltage-gated potassium channel